MGLALETLEAEMVKLPSMERSHLLDRLVASLDADNDIQASWVAEGQRRDQEIESGTAALLPGNAVIAQFREQLA